MRVNRVEMTNRWNEEGEKELTILTILHHFRKSVLREGEGKEGKGIKGRLGRFINVCEN